MRLEYKSVAKIESFGKHSIGVNIQIAVHRKLFDDEQYQIDETARNIIRLIDEYTILNNQEYKDEIVDTKTKLLACFNSPIYIKTIPNEYTTSKLNLYSWYSVTTPKGIIKIGWRKRVINIDWTESDIKSKSEDLFKEEDTTKYDKVVHAWGYDKAREYINKLLNSQ